MTNGVVTKTYEQPYEWENLNAEASNTNIRCFLVVEGSYIDFLSSKIGTTGGNVSADKKSEINGTEKCTTICGCWDFS